MAGFDLTWRKRTRARPFPFPATISLSVNTGYNTDVKHKSRVFHVQTEDKGEGNPWSLTPRSRRTAGTIRRSRS
jgi:hypothetical protein